MTLYRHINVHRHVKNTKHTGKYTLNTFEKYQDLENIKTSGCTAHVNHFVVKPELMNCTFTDIH